MHDSSMPRGVSSINREEERRDFEKVRSKVVAEQRHRTPVPHGTIIIFPREVEGKSVIWQNDLPPGSRTAATEYVFRHRAGEVSGGCFEPYLDPNHRHEATGKPRKRGADHVDGPGSDFPRKHRKVSSQLESKQGASR